nr:J91 [uncultured bacterium]
MVIASLGDEGIYPKVVAILSLLTVVLLGQAVRRHYFRCPVCSAPLPRGPKQVVPANFFHGYCKRCGTEFRS